MDAVAKNSVLDYAFQAEDQGSGENFLPGPPIDPDPPLPPDDHDSHESSVYSGVNVLNYTEQGGSRTVIGGELVFKEGARVVGFPGSTPMPSKHSTPTEDPYFVIDLEGVDISSILDAPVEVTGLFPPEDFNAASYGYKPVLFRNAVYFDQRFSVLTTTAREGCYITGLGIIPAGINANISYLVTIMLYKDDEERIMLRANQNRRLAFAFFDEPEEATTPEFAKVATLDDAKDVANQHFMK